MATDDALTRLNKSPSGTRKAHQRRQPWALLEESMECRNFHFVCGEFRARSVRMVGRPLSSSGAGRGSSGSPALGATRRAGMTSAE